MSIRVEIKDYSKDLLQTNWYIHRSIRINAYLKNTFGQCTSLTGSTAEWNIKRQK